MPDGRDQTLLRLLQDDSDMPLAELSQKVNLSPSACSRRIKFLREAGYISRNVAVLDRDKLNVPATVFACVRLLEHRGHSAEKFREAVARIAEIVEVHRVAGNFDYILKIVVPTVGHYDFVYKRLVATVEMREIAGYISMEDLKGSAGLPVGYLELD